MINEPVKSCRKTTAGSHGEKACNRTRWIREQKMDVERVNWYIYVAIYLEVFT